MALIAPAWPTATFGSATKLFIADHRQYWPQPLVIGDSALVDVADLVKGAVSEINAEGLCRCFRCDQHLVGGGLKTGSNGPFVTTSGQCRSQRDKPSESYPQATAANYRIR